MKSMLRSAATLAITGMSVLAACSSKDTSGQNASTTSSADSGRTVKAPPANDTAGMNGMKMGSTKVGQTGQMGGMMAGSAMMDSMQGHMRMMMQGVTANQMKAMLPAHRQMVANMLAQLNGEMRKMNMSGDAKWAALTDSVRQDLKRMPDMSGAELRSFMPQHGARVMRLMDMHRSMMGGTKM
jgi:hypothetical protein